jgi:RimJ/RimL family protein N-acetyltransferase
MKIQFGNYQIRSFELRDKASLIKYANNKNIADNLRDRFPYPYTEETADEWLTIMSIQNPEINFAIANENELIGGIGIDIQEDIFRYSAEIGYWLAEPFWGKGIITEALNLYSDYVFEKFNLVRLFAGVFDHNSASAKVLEKAGYKLEGRMVKAVFKNGKFYDQLLYAKIK